MAGSKHSATWLNFEEVGELGHRADGGARGLDGIRLLDGDRRADVFDRVDLGLVEEVEELARVGGEGFDVTALSLGVQRVEDERGFAGAAQAGDDDVSICRGGDRGRSL